MTIDPKLMKALLAMDSYNRGYNAGIDFGVDPDNANIGIGSAQTTITSSILVDENGMPMDQPAGFYAIAYQYNGGTIISYRGTDELFGTDRLNGDIGSDIWNGYTAANDNIRATHLRAMTGAA